MKVFVNRPHTDYTLPGLNLTRRGIFGLCLALLIVFSFTQWAAADELSEIKESMKAMQKQMEENTKAMQKQREENTRAMQKQAMEMQKMQEKIEALESEKAMRMAQPAEVGEDKVSELKDDVEFMKYQQEGFLQRLDEFAEIHLNTTLSFENFENSQSEFDAHSIELFVSADLTDRLTAFAEIEFEHLATSEEGTREGEIEVEQGWIDYYIKDWFTPRFGVILVPFGKYNQTHFDPYRDFTDPPIAMDVVVPVGWSDLGIGFHGQVFPGSGRSEGFLKNLSLNYQLYVTQGFSELIGDDGGFHEARPGYSRDNNNNKAVVGRLGISPYNDQEIGISGYYGKYDRDGNSVAGFDIDWLFTAGPFQLIGEYAYFDIERGEAEPGGDAAESKLDEEEGDFELELPVPGTLHGGYFQGNYHFWFDSLNGTFLGQGFDNPTFTASLRYGFAIIDDDGDEGTGRNKEQRVSFGLNYRPVETVVFKFSYQINDTDNERLSRGSDNGFLFSIAGAF